MKTGRPLPDRALLLTFDDGYREISEIVAPILLEKGVSATFFVNSAFTDNKELCYLNKASLIATELEKHRSRGLTDTVLGRLASKGVTLCDPTSGILSITYQQRHLLDDLATLCGVDFDHFLATNKPYLTSDQIYRLIERGFTVGAHSIDHPMYQQLSLDEQLQQTTESVKFVKETFNLSYGVFAFPFSDRNISELFFTRLSGSGLVDLSFGTGGLIEDTAPNHLQRFSLEKPIEAARKILAFQYAKKLKNVLVRRPRVIRR
jgi:peptidoglycan/xylan/chitin deacetylase (PgdA/CDA1 family)